jgi:putative peptide maturation system protein
MSETVRLAVCDALGFLTATVGDDLAPGDAQRALRAVQDRHPAIGMELVWEREPYDGSLHYDILLRPPGGSTVSLSFCTDHGLPWPLRGIRRWSDAELAQINTQVLTMREAVEYLDVIWEEAPIMRRMIDSCVVREELDHHPIEITDAELQHGMDGWRRSHALYTTDATLRWMDHHGMTHDRLELLVADSLSAIKLRERIVADRVAPFFEQHAGELATAQIARIVCADEAAARRVHRDIVTDELEFFAAAQRQFLAAPDAQQGSFATLRRWDVTEEVATLVFSASAGEVIGPILLDGEHVVARVLAVTPARLDAATRTVIEDRLFEDWLADRRASARITWYWGTAERDVPAVDVAR